MCCVFNLCAIKAGSIGSVFHDTPLELAKGTQPNMSYEIRDAYWSYGVQLNQHILTVPEHLLTNPEDV